MGIESRGYYRDSYEYQRPWGASFQRSIVMMLVIANAALFLADVFTPRVFPDGSLVPGNVAVGNSGHWLSHFLSLKSDFWQRPWEFFTLVSYGFAHSPLDSPGGPMHLIFNMLSLVFLGPPIEERLGRREFLLFYLTALVAAAFAFLASAWLLGSPRICLGASGAVTAVVMLFVFHFPKQRLWLMGLIEVPAWTIGVLLVVTDLLRALNPNSSIAAETHLAGAAFAAAYFWGRWNLETVWQRLTRRRPNLRIHPDQDLEPTTPGDASWRRLQEEGDRLLEKINRDGQDSLTWRERRTLQKYSQQLRDRRQ